MVREKSQFFLEVTFEGGIDRFSGLLEIGLDTGFVVKPKNGWYAKVNQETGEIIEPNLRLKQLNTDEFWADILASKKFNDFVESRFKVAHNNLQAQIAAIAADEEEEEDA